MFLLLWFAQPSTRKEWLLNELITKVCHRLRNLSRFPHSFNTLSPLFYRSFLWVRNQRSLQNEGFSMFNKHSRSPSKLVQKLIGISFRRYHINLYLQDGILLHRNLKSLSNVVLGESSGQLQGISEDRSKVFLGPGSPELDYPKKKKKKNCVHSMSRIKHCYREAAEFKE